MVTQFDSTASLRFAAKGTCGDRIEVADFTLDGEAAVTGHSWIAQVRDHAGVLVADLEVQRSVVSVDAPGDSARIVLVLSAAHSAAIAPGVYMVEAEDVTQARTRATGTLRLERDWAT